MILYFRQFLDLSIIFLFKNTKTFFMNIPHCNTFTFVCYAKTTEISNFDYTFRSLLELNFFLWFPG